MAAMSSSDLQPLEVIWLHHGTARGLAKTRMMVCISPEDGFFLPINTTDRFRPCFTLPRIPHHDWLKHDSHIECDVLVFDEYPVEESIAHDGIIGYVDFSHIDDILVGWVRPAFLPGMSRG